MSVVVTVAAAGRARRRADARRGRPLQPPPDHPGPGRRRAEASEERPRAGRSAPAGLGSPTLLYLAAAGVGTIGIVEFDVVDESNLQRQIIHGQSDIGRSKAQSARDSIAEINPLVSVRLHEFRLEPDNAVDLFEQYDLIIDGTDNFATRYLVNDAAVLAGKPYVWGSIYRFEGQVSVFWEDAPDAPDGRAGLNYRDLYPEPPPPGMVPSCAEGGVLGILCASIASVMGTEAIKLITGIGEPLLGRLMVYDALDMTLPHHQDPQGSGQPEDHRTDRLRGVLRCGVEAAPSRREPTITPSELRELLDSGTKIALIDVREPVEWDINHIDGRRADPEVGTRVRRGPGHAARTTAHRCCTARPGCARPRRWPP